MLCGGADDVVAGVVFVVGVFSEPDIGGCPACGVEGYFVAEEF